MVSVILPSYNHAPFLKERIDSILNQTFEDFELIILDDKSPDNSQEIIETYRGNPKISHIIFNEENSGSTFKQWSKGIELAEGDYIWIAESDDIALPDFLKILYNNIIKNDAVISYCQSYKIDKNGNITGDWSDYTQPYAAELFANDFAMNGIEFLKKYFLIKNFMPNASAVLFKKSTFMSIGGIQTNVGYITDWLCWQKLLTKGKVVFTSQKLNYYRNHENSVVALLWSDSKKLIHKKPHIDLRIAFGAYLKSNNINKTLYKKNKKFLLRNIMEEAHFLLCNKKFASSFKYGFMILKYIFK